MAKRTPRRRAESAQAKNPARGPRPGHEPSSLPSGGRFITTTVEVEGREETKIVELPEFELEPWTDDDLQHVGTRALRVDSLEKVTGGARYTADIARPRLAYAAILRASIPRGTVTLDTRAARDIPGVLDVLTADDVRDVLAGGAARLFSTQVNYAGQPIAAVCAESPAAAWRGVRAIEVSAVPSPFVVTFDAAISADAPLVRSTGNLTKESPIVAERGDVARGLSQAAVVIRRTYRTPVALHTALEPHGAAAEWIGGRLVAWESTQGIFRTRDQLATAFKLPRTMVRVIKDYMGGGFGAKNGAGAHSYTAAFFARRLGRPVRCINDREGEQMDAGNRPATEQHVTLAATRDGRLTAIVLDADIPLGVGGWEGGPGKIYHELYSCPNVRTTERFAYVNTSAMSAFRGPGHCEGAFGLECAMDALARELGMDPIALRLANFAEHDEEKQRPWSSNRLRECYAEGARRFGWVERGGDDRRHDSVASDRENDRMSLAGGPRARRIRRGTGMAAQIWGAGGGPPAYAFCTVHSDGSVEILSGTQDLGTGARTVFAQIAADAIGARLADVRVVLGDTERTPYAGNSWGSMTTASVGPAVRMAAEDAKRQLLAAAAQMLDVTPKSLTVRDSTITVRRSGRSMTFAELCDELGDVMIVGRGSRGPNPQQTAIMTFGAQFAEVEVDLDTGVVRVRRIVAAHDAGRIVNPTLAESQLEGGILQGLGYALFEERVLDERLGVPLNPTMHDYKIPTIADCPAIDAFFVAGDDPVANHVGARGIAEPPIIPTAPAIANAVADALGVEVTEIPLTPWRVLGAI